MPYDSIIAITAAVAFILIYLFDKKLSPDKKTEYRFFRDLFLCIAIALIYVALILSPNLSSNTITHPAYTLLTTNVPLSCTANPRQFQVLFLKDAKYPSDPGPNSNSVFRMSGFGNSIRQGVQALRFTPTTTGNVLINITGSGTTSTTGTEMQIQLAYGTGTAPSTLSAFTGNFLFQTVSIITTSTGAEIPFKITGFTNSLVVGTNYWFDLVQNRSSGTGTIQILHTFANFRELNTTSFPSIPCATTNQTVFVGSFNQTQSYNYTNNGVKISLTNLTFMFYTFLFIILEVITVVQMLTDLLDSQIEHIID